MLSEKAIKEMQQIWQETFQEEISEEFAIEIGVTLIEFYQLIAPRQDELGSEDNIEEEQVIAI